MGAVHDDNLRGRKPHPLDRYPGQLLAWAFVWVRDLGFGLRWLSICPRSSYLTNIHWRDEDCFSPLNLHMYRRHYSSPPSLTYHGGMEGTSSSRTHPPLPYHQPCSPDYLISSPWWRSGLSGLFVCLFVHWFDWLKSRMVLSHVHGYSAHIQAHTHTQPTIRTLPNEPSKSVSPVKMYSKVARGTL